MCASKSRLGQFGLLILTSTLVTVGCASSKPNLSYMTDGQWRDALRARGVNPDSIPNPLLVTTPMKEAAQQLTRLGDTSDRLHRLQNALFHGTTFPFHYDSRETLTAAETFHRREGNCLSFTNLFVAMARSLGIRVTTALVKRPGGSEKEGDLIVVQDHVVAMTDFEQTIEFFDFDRTPHPAPSTYKPLNDLWITALYLNNRGAEELRAGHPDIALRFFGDAVKLALDFAPAWGNVGVAYRRVGKAAEAYDAYRQALAIEPGNPTILNNLAVLYRSTGKYQEAEAAVAAANLSQASPHVLIVRGDVEYARGRYDEALRLYKRAQRLGPKLADPWVAMAKIAIAQKRPTKARNYLNKALALEPNHTDALALLTRIENSGQVSARTTN